MKEEKKSLWSEKDDVHGLKIKWEGLGGFGPFS